MIYISVIILIFFHDSVTTLYRNSIIVIIIITNAVFNVSVFSLAFGSLLDRGDPNEDFLDPQSNEEACIDLISNAPLLILE